MKRISIILAALGSGLLLLEFLYCFPNTPELSGVFDPNSFTSPLGRSGLFDPIIFSVPFIFLMIVGVIFAVKGVTPKALIRLLIVIGIAGFAFGPFVEVMGIVTTNSAVAESGRRPQNPFAEVLLIGFALAFVGAVALVSLTRPRSVSPNKALQATATRAGQLKEL